MELSPDNSPDNSPDREGPRGSTDDAIWELCVEKKEDIMKKFGIEMVLSGREAYSSRDLHNLRVYLINAELEFERAVENGDLDKFEKSYDLTPSNVSPS